jgi:glycosyltransferase involved in cell wall biosynthesis
MPMNYPEKTYVIIPAYNEENSVGQVIRAIPKALIHEIIVVNNNSNDDTRINALKEGAIVLDEKTQGYGAACLKGLSYLKTKAEKPGIVIFLDAYFSDHP